MSLTCGFESHLAHQSFLRNLLEDRDATAVSAADELDDNDLRTAGIILAIDAAIKKTAEAVKTAAQAAQAAREHARAEQVRAVAELREEGLTMQDIATVLGVTKGRISQLAHA